MRWGGAGGGRALEVAAALVVGGCVLLPFRTERGPNDASWRDARAPAGERGWIRRSQYLRMRDGVEIAVDLTLPAELAPGERVPAILRQTRYFRSTAYRGWVRPFLDRPLPETERFVASGYAWIDVDARGSGASGGTHPHPWSADEIADAGEIVDWIVRQPWSSGRVGATGVSYDGTAAEFLGTRGHPAVLAVAPRFSLFDVYADVAFPGGVHLHWFTEQWNRYNRALDRNRLLDVMPWPVWLFSRGVRPVEGQAGKLAAHVRDHAANVDIHAASLEIVHRDDPGGPSRLQPDDFSPHARSRELEAAGVPVLSYSGWFDGAYARSAIGRFQRVRTPGSRLVLGPWSHGGSLHVRPGRRSRPSSFDHAGELLRFFDGYLRAGAGAAPGPPVAYYTMGEERWKTAERWPPPAQREDWHLAGEGALARAAGPTGVDRHAVDFSAGSGERSRWRCLMGARFPVDYGDRAERDAALLTYTSPPLERDVEVTGHARAVLWLASSARDGAVFAYLEDVHPDGRVAYVTEGLLRLLHRKTPRSYLRADASPLEPGRVEEIAVELLPTSYRFARGHAIRLALAGADADHFARIPAAGDVAWELHRGAARPSRLELPVVTTP